MHEENWQSNDAVQIVSKELFKVWIDANVYPISEQAIAQKIFTLVNEFKRIEHYPKSKRGSAFQKRVERFTENIDKLFDVFNQDKKQRKTIEKNPKLHRNEADWNLYHDQR